MRQGKQAPIEEDQDLIQASLRGDTEAYGRLVTKYKERAVRAAYLIVRNTDDAADVAQEGFVKAFRSLKNFKGDSSFYTWLYRILVNLALDARRKSARRPEVEYDDGLKKEVEESETQQYEGDPDPRSILEEAEMNTLINREIGQLPEHHRTAIMLREIEGLSYQEIADVMDCSIGTVMSRLHYARVKLREALEPYLNTGRKP